MAKLKCRTKWTVKLSNLLFFSVENNQHIPKQKYIKNGVGTKIRKDHRVGENFIIK